MAENKLINNTNSWEVSHNANDYFSVNTSSVKQTTASRRDYYVQEGQSLLNNEVSNIGQSAKGVLNAVTTVADPNQYLNLGTAIVNSVSNAAYDTVRKIFDSFTQTQEITISSLMQEIAPYAADFKTAGDSLVSTIKKYTSKFEDIGDWISTIGGNVVSEVMNDPSVVEAISNLSLVQTYAGTLNTASEVINGVEKVVKVVDPLLSIVRMVSNFSLAFWSGGSTAAEESTNITNDVAKVSLLLSSIAMYYVKKYVYGIKIKVPKILVSTVSALSVKNAVGDFDMSDKWSLLASTLFNDDFYNTAMIRTSTSNKNSKTWLKATEDFYKDSLTWSKDQIKNATTLGWKAKDPDSWWGKYKSSFVTSFMSKAIASARANIYSTSYENFNVYIDKLISDYGASTDATLSTDRFISTSQNSWEGIVQVSNIIYKNITGRE